MKSQKYEIIMKNKMKLHNFNFLTLQLLFNVIIVTLS